MSGAAPVGIYPSPILAPSVWDTFTVQGVSWQGKIRIQGATRSHRWDVKDPPGADGEIQTYRGRRTKPFRVTFWLWAESHFGTWPQFSLLFQYPASKLGVAPPVSVYHPSLAMLGISAVTCEDLGGVEQVGEETMWTATVVLRQYIPPPPVNTTATPTGAAAVHPPSVPGNVPNPAIAALELRIEALQQQAANLGTPGGLP